MPTRIFLWSDPACRELRRPFGRKRRDWVAHVPKGGELGEVNWERVLLVDREDGSTVIAGNDPRMKPQPHRRAP